MNTEDVIVAKLIEDRQPDLPGVPSPYTEGARIMRRHEMPDGWHGRVDAGAEEDDHPFFDMRDYRGLVLIEARPIPVPDVVVTLPRDVAERYATGAMNWCDYEVLKPRLRAALDGDQ